MYVARASCPVSNTTVRIMVLSGLGAATGGTLGMFMARMAMLQVHAIALGLDAGLKKLTEKGIRE